MVKYLPLGIFALIIPQFLLVLVLSSREQGEGFKKNFRSRTRPRQEDPFFLLLCPTTFLGLCYSRRRLTNFISAKITLCRNRAACLSASVPLQASSTSASDVAPPPPKAASPAALLMLPSTTTTELSAAIPSSQTPPPSSIQQQQQQLVQRQATPTNELPPDASSMLLLHHQSSKAAAAAGLESSNSDPPLAMLLNKDDPFSGRKVEFINRFSGINCGHSSSGLIKDADKLKLMLLAWNYQNSSSAVAGKWASVVVSKCPAKPIP